MPLVSVVIPTCNRPELLSRSLRSVLGQTFRDLEVIVVDDGDRISVENVVRGFNDLRVRYFRNDPPRRGGGAARNRGIREAKGEIIAFQDDDDEWIPEKLDIQLKRFLEAPDGVGFCVSAVTTTWGDGRSDVTHIEDGILDFSEIALARPKGFLTVTLLFRKHVLEEVGMFDESFPSHQEAELMIRVTQKYRGLGIDRPLVRVSMGGPDHVGGNINRRIAGRTRLLTKHMVLFKKHPRILSRHIFQVGLWYRDSGDVKKARGYFFNAFKTYPHPLYVAHIILMLFASQKDLH